MVKVTDEFVAVIKNDYLYHNLKPYGIWKKHTEFGCTRQAIEKIIWRYKETGLWTRKPGTGAVATASTEENLDETETLIQSQEEEGTQKSVREIAEHLDVGKSSVHRMAQKKWLKAYRRAITPQVTSAARLRRYDRSRDLLMRFNETHLKKFCFQDEKDFSLQIATNRKNNVVWSSKKKTEIAPERLFHERNKQSKKVMVSAAISWNGVTEPFFVSDTDTNIKLNGPRYLEHLRGELMPAISRMQTTNKKYIFLQDSAPSHRAKQVRSFQKLSMTALSRAQSGHPIHRI